MDKSKSFAGSFGFMLGSRDERLWACFCPKCAYERVRAVTPSGDEIVCVQTVPAPASTARCSNCDTTPLIWSAEEQLDPRTLVDFMGRVLKMAELERRRVKVYALDPSK